MTNAARREEPSTPTGTTIITRSTILQLAALACCCERTARRRLRGEFIAGDVGRRLNAAAIELGIPLPEER